MKHGLILRLTLSDETVSPTESVMKCACSVSMDGVTFVHLGDGWGAGCDKGDKAPMKSVTAASKYALANAFCISLGEDPEADAETDKAADKHIGPGGAYGPEETARAEEQAIHVGMLAKGFGDAFTAMTHVDDVMEWVHKSMDEIDSLGEPGRKAVLATCKEHVKAGRVEGLNFEGLKQLWNAARDASREKANGGRRR